MKDPEIDEDDIPKDEPEDDGDEVVTNTNAYPYNPGPSGSYDS